MVQRSLHEIRESDLQALIDNGVPEKKTIEYKSALPGRADQDKKEFLADISSFANTSGGDLIFGMEEDSGRPTKIGGISTNDLGSGKERLENLIRAGLDPRIRYDLAEVSCAAGCVLVIRIDQSWVRPHRVILGGHDKFYGRNSTGKYPLDVGELRAAFTGSEALSERIRAFRVDRTIAIGNNETPVPFISGAKIVLHCIPLESFGGQKQIDFPAFHRDFARWLPPLNSVTLSRRINLDGTLFFSQLQDGAGYYQQIFRSGVIETVDGWTLFPWHGGVELTIPSPTCEQFILRHLRDCATKLLHVGISAPVVVALTLTGVKGFRMAIQGAMPVFARPDAIPTNVLSLPETVIEDLSTPAEKVLKPVFDVLWNACGHPESPSFKKDGSWKHGTY